MKSDDGKKVDLVKSEISCIKLLETESKQYEDFLALSDKLSKYNGKFNPN